jgi:hypothetical protein
LVDKLAKRVAAARKAKAVAKLVAKVTAKNSGELQVNYRCPMRASTTFATSKDSSL